LPTGIPEVVSGTCQDWAKKPTKGPPIHRENAETLDVTAVQGSNHPNIEKVLPYQAFATIPETEVLQAAKSKAPLANSQHCKQAFD
jgi:hypothetical protein